MALRGIRVIELAGLAPVPFCGMVLADFGANVIRVDKANAKLSVDCLGRGKRSIAIDLKRDSGKALLRRLADKSDVLLDPFRPGVLEKLGLAPDLLLRSNPGLIIARITGYGQDGPFAKCAGHDLNYVAVSGVLSFLGRSGNPPFPPVNLLADFAGGGLLAAMGVCAALVERNRSGKGQVIDASMTEGTAYVSSFLWRSRTVDAGVPLWFSKRGENILDGGAHFYQVYETSDGKYMAVGALEPQFYDAFVRGIGKSVDNFPQLQDFRNARQQVASIFKQKTLAEWVEIFHDTDACVTPVIDFQSAADCEHSKARQSFVDYAGLACPAPAPRLSRTPAQPCLEEPLIGQHTRQVFDEIGLTSAEQEAFLLEHSVSLPKEKF